MSTYSTTTTATTTKHKRITPKKRLDLLLRAFYDLKWAADERKMDVSDLFDLVGAGELPPSSDVDERLAVLDYHGCYIEAEQDSGVDASLLFACVKVIADARDAERDAKASVLDLLSP